MQCGTNLGGGGVEQVTSEETPAGRILFTQSPNDP
jgi:hypothetical protein